ncbi:MAG: hypothetical protein ACR2QZ_09035 [Woeseiaceae bacterium]
MRFLISLFLGMLTGAALFIVGMVYNPFIADRGISPLAVSNSDLIALNFSAVPAESIIFTNNGTSLQKPYPEKVMQLWEAPIRETSAMTTVMWDARNQTAGIGIKFSSLSEQTRLLQGDALVDSVWYIFLPERGSLFIQQSENHWAFLRDVGWPAYRNGGSNWKGNWIGDLTSGPGVLGTAMVTGGSGLFRGLTMEGVESLSAQAFSADLGPISAKGRLLIELPDTVVDAETEVASD